MKGNALYFKRYTSTHRLIQDRFFSWSSFFNIWLFFYLGIRITTFNAHLGHV